MIYSPQQQKNGQIEVRFASVRLPSGTGIPAGGKGSPPKCPEPPGLGMLGRQRRSAGLSQVSCEALSMAVRCAFFAPISVCPWIAFQAIHFFVSIERIQKIEREARKMRRFMTLILAMAMLLTLTACGGNSNANSAADTAAVTGVEDGVLSIAMECAYAP